MECWHNRCQKRGIIRYQCECNHDKVCCDDHKQIIKLSKMSCKLGWTCYKFFSRRKNGCTLLLTECFSLSFYFCSSCTIQLLNDLLHQDKKPKRSSPFTEFSNCHTEISPVNNVYGPSSLTDGGRIFLPFLQTRESRFHLDNYNKLTWNFAGT